jgi:hypothetical protein
MLLLALFIAFVPVVKAACDAEHAAALADTTTATAVAASDVTSRAAPNDEACSTTSLHTLTAPDQTAALAAQATPPTLGWDALAPARAVLATPAYVPSAVPRRLAPSPYEPVSRRTRRLLI